MYNDNKPYPYGMRHITFHDLRHSCLTILANSNGCTIRQVQAYAGHANYNITVNLPKGHTPQSSHIRQRALPTKAVALLFIYLP